MRWHHDMYLVLRIPNCWHCSCGCRIMNATLHLVSIRSICLWASALKLFVECSLSSISLFFHQLGHNGFHCLCSLWKRMKRKMRWKFLGQLLWRIFVFAEDVIKRICLRHCNTLARCYVFIFIQVQKLHQFSNAMMSNVILDRYSFLIINIHIKVFRKNQHSSYLRWTFGSITYEKLYLPIFQVHCWDRVPLH